MKHRYLASVSTLKLATEKCTGCGRCAEVCPHGVFELRVGKAAIIDVDGCMECGACAQNCPSGALSVRSGVGCAAAMINGLLTRGDPDAGTCDCGGNPGGCC